MEEEFEQPKKKHYWIWIIIGMVVLALLIFFLLIPALKTSKCSSSNDKNYCLMNLGIKEHSFYYCDQITDNSTYFKETCYLEVANYKADESDCEKPELKDIRDSCFRIVAVSLNSTSICDKIINQTQMGMCLGELAFKLKDKTICEQIIDLYWKDGCYFALKECSLIQNTSTFKERCSV